MTSEAIKLDGPDVVRLPLITGNRVEATANAQKVMLLVDFGYSGAVRLSDVAWTRVMGGSNMGAAGQNGIRAEGTVIQSRVANGALSIGRLASGAAPIASGYAAAGATPSDSLLGTGFFLQGTSVIDGPARQVMLIVRQNAQSAPGGSE